MTRLAASLAGAYGGDGRHMLAMHSSPVRQHCPQPQSVSPRAQSATHAPETQICPQLQPPGHALGAHWYWLGVEGLALRLHVLPVGHRPGQ